ncbi:winged helix-turn-helix transcriptional regulator [Natronomonas sp. EA1]|uniref:winged helix-turn-helix transcriptional regulator n=1 Tax=Natronomonas sp. EA1 TaxID=3421655 RepID=UPI003EB794C2
MVHAQSPPIEVWCAGEEWCPITATASLIGKKWHPVVVHRLLEAPLGFNDLKRAVNGISSKVLTDCLTDLEANQLLTRRVVSEHPLRVEYELTDHGQSLSPVLLAMRDWGEEHLVAASSPA